jgi:actin-like ATPase involved in cell morphogenesis
MVCIPGSHTEVERRAVQESARAAGARDVVVVQASMAAAIGAGLPVELPVGNLVVDLGAGRIEAMVSSLGGVVLARDAGYGGDAMDAAIEVHGIVGGFIGEGGKTVIPAQAYAKINAAIRNNIRGSDIFGNAHRAVEGQ